MGSPGSAQGYYISDDGSRHSPQKNGQPPEGVDIGDVTQGSFPTDVGGYRAVLIDGVDYGDVSWVRGGASDNQAPVVSASPLEAVWPGTAIPLTSLFSFSDPDGNDQIKSFYVTDVGNKGGYLTKAGLAQGQGAKVGSQPIDDVDQWAFVAGPDGSSDDVRFTVEDIYGAYNKKAAVATVHAVDEAQVVLPPFQRTLRRLRFELR